MRGRSTWVGCEFGIAARKFRARGYYSVQIPSLSRHRIVVVNSVFFSNLYDNSCGSEMQTPGDDEMSWLAEVLDKASNAGERVWWLMHIPVGINDYNTVKNEEAGSPPVEFWKPEYTSTGKPFRSSSPDIRTWMISALSERMKRHLSSTSWCRRSARSSGIIPLFKSIDSRRAAVRLPPTRPTTWRISRPRVDRRDWRTCIGYPSMNFVRRIAKRGWIFLP